MKKRYMMPEIDVIVVVQWGVMLAVSGGGSMSRGASVGADGNAFQDDFNNGNVSVVGDVTDRGPSSTAKKYGFFDRFD